MSWVDAKLETFLHHLAYVHLLTELKSFVSSDGGFVIVCVLEDTSLETYYSTAAKAIFKSRQNPVEDFYFGESKLLVVPSERASAAAVAAYQDLNRADRVIFFYEDVMEVPDILELGADGMIPLGVFTAEHMKVAIAQFLNQSISDEDALFLAGQSADTLNFCLRSTHSYEAALAKIRDLHKAKSLRLAAVQKIEVKTKSGVRIKDKKPTKEAQAQPTQVIRLEDLVGYGEAKSWALLLRDEIRRLKAGAIQPDDLDRGVVLSGPPGVGKSAFAEIVAAACEVPIVRGSYALWQAAGHMGDQLKAMRASFKEASACAPCILVIDEMDSFNDRETDDYNAEYSRKVVNGLLELLDGPERAPGVVVIGTTNRIENVDKAILRAGRVSEIFELDYPDASERRQIASIYLKEDVPQDVLEDFREATDGMSGAGIQHLARKVKRSLRIAANASLSDAIREHLPVFTPFPPERVRSIATHEAGHALVALAIGVDVESVTVTDRAREGELHVVGGQMRQVGKDFERGTAKDILNRICILFAGIVAEELAFGDFDCGAGVVEGSDLLLATDYATVYEYALGMGETLIAESLTSPKDIRNFRTLHPSARRRIEDILGAQKDRARQILEPRKAVLEALAEELSVRKYMSGEELHAFLSALPKGGEAAA